MTRQGESAKRMQKTKGQVEADDDVVERGEVEIEYGHGFVHGEERELFVPEVVVNLGLTDNFELVAESVLVLRDEGAARGGFNPDHVEFVHGRQRTPSPEVD